jgi:hypothetical protein
MAISNFIQWNPTAANQESDAAYLADSQRAGGAATPSLFAATLGNKLFYQLSTCVTALNKMLANKGFNVSDVDVNVLAAQYGNLLTTADMRAGLIAVPYASTLAFDCTKSNGFHVTLTGDLTFTLTGPSVGQQIVLAFTQDSTGNHAVNWPGVVRAQGTLMPNSGYTSTQAFVVLDNNQLYPIGPMTVA